MLQPIYIKFCPYYVKIVRWIYLNTKRLCTKTTGHLQKNVNINKECAQISFKSLAIFIRLSDIAYQNIMFIKKLENIFLLPKISCFWHLVN